MVLVPFLGVLTDSCSFKATIPMSFFLRATGMLAFLFLSSPEGFTIYLISAIIGIGNVMENITIDGLYSKHLPKEVRGTLNGLKTLLSGIGLMVFSKLTGVFTSPHLGTFASFHHKYIIKPFKCI